jgi:hypothetical protein
MNGEVTADTDGEVERAQDLHWTGVEKFRQVRIPGREWRFGRCRVEYKGQRPRLTIKDCDG